MAGEGWVDVQVTGLKELEETLKRLPDDLAVKALAQAVFAGAVVVRDEARRLCPVDTGNLRRSIRIKRKKRHGLRNATVLYQVGPGRSGKKGPDGKYATDGYYGHMVEFGTAPHVIKAGDKKKRLGKKGVFGRYVKHPGASARPFLRPAFDNSTDRVIEAMRARLAQAIERGEIKFWKRHIASRR
jgi:HK97 gp10 family phage protein